MRGLFSLGVLLVLLRLSGSSQEVPAEPSSRTAADPTREALSSSAAFQLEDPDTAQASTPGADSPAPLSTRQGIASNAPRSRFRFYIGETYENLSLLTAPAFRASLRMANPPGRGTTRYPDEWRQGVEGFGRNYGDAFATRISTHTAQFLAGMVTREDPNYAPSASRNFILRTSHALAFTFVDRSDSGRPSIAFSNFVGAAAGGFVGNLYLPDGFRDMTHAGQRATFQFGTLAAGNLFREFYPQIPGPVRALLSLVAR